MQIGDGGMTRKVGNKQEEERKVYGKVTSDERARVNRMAKRLFERVNTVTHDTRAQNGTVFFLGSCELLI